MGFMDSMKGIAAKVGTTVEKGAKSVSDGSKKMAEKSKVKREISQLEAEINNSYLAIGKKYFELHSASPEEGFADDVNKIIANTDRAEKFRLLLASLDAKTACANCGAEVTKEQKFCDKCGAKVEFPDVPIIEGFNDAPEEVVDVAPAAETPAEEAPAAAAPSFCTSCGAPLEPGQKFCDKCGTKID